MPLVGPLTPPSSDESEGGGTALDPLNFVQVLIPVRFPADLSINLNCVSILSTSSGQSSPGSCFSPSVSTPRSTAPSYSSPHSSASSHNEESHRTTSFSPIDEVSEDFGEEEIERILRESDSNVTSVQDDYTECDLEDVDLEEFQEGTGQVTSTTSRGSDTPSRGNGSDNDDEEESVVENPNPVPCGHCQGGKDPSGSGDLIWPIQLDLDLVKTLLHLCPDFFEDFDEVEMDSTELSSLSQDPPSTTQDTLPTSTTASTGSNNQSEGSQPSPPNVQVDDSPLQPCMVRNKESLKVKLLLRRPMNQLIEQGILPPSKTPPAFAEQRVRLERARMGDLLKAKIQQRPARQELIRQHILEESDSRVAPSLAEKQRMLKRARLADSLNDHLIHRPGPLELVQKNILHAPDAIIDQAIKEGVVEFKATSEGLFPGPHVPSNIYLSEDESSSDLSSPAGTPDQSQSSSSSNETQAQKGGTLDLSPLSVQSPISTTAPNAEAPPSLVRPTIFPLPPTSLPIPSATQSTVVNNAHVLQPSTLPLSFPQVTQVQQSELLSKIVKAAVTSSTTPPITSAQLTLSKLSTFEHQQFLSDVRQTQPQPRTLSNPVTTQGLPNAFSQQHASTGKTRTAKKSTPKIKATPKARMIKFHEYLGPPNAQKQKGQTQTAQQEAENSSSYELLLRQQQLFLQWTLECRHKYPQIILPAVSKLASPTEVAATFASAVNAANAAAVSMVPGSIVTATTTSPLVRSPSTIASVMNSNNTGTPGQQPIAPAPPPPITVQALIEKYNKNVAAVTGTLPLKITVPQMSNTGLTDIRPKLTPSRSFDSPPSSGSSPKSTTHLDMAKLNEWKVTDLKTELKKRNLPVSGAKPLLIERLKMAGASLQDESISSSSNGKSIKSEAVTPVEESCSNEMDVSDGLTLNNDSSNVTVLNAAMLTLLQNNNLQNNGVIPVHILNALANVAKDKSGTNGRIALQQYLGQKRHQQALQSQLQKLIQLNSLQQQAQKYTQGQKPVTGNLLPRVQQAQIQILSPKYQPALSEKKVDTRATTLTLHQSEEEIPTSSASALIGLNDVPITSDVSLQEPVNVSFDSSPKPSSQELRFENEEVGVDFSNIPQLQIRETKNSAFHVGESESSSNQSTKSGSFSSDVADPMDHSWLLKINETPPTLPNSEEDSEPRKSVVKEYANFFESFANGDQKKEELKLQIPKPRCSFKSEMVDDVLEILIRNGELPESAAQDPSTPIPGKTPEVLLYQPSMPSSNIPSLNEDSKLSTSITTPPTPPPLPPPSFAVTLPTSITFTRPSTATTLVNPFQNNQRSSDEKGPPPPYPTDSLSKEAQDILKISQDLSNFGKAHTQSESERHFSASAKQLHLQTEELGHLDYDSNSFAMLLDQVEKDAMSSMEMDTQDTQLQQRENLRPFHVPADEEMPVENNHVKVKQEELLDEIGTLLPPDLDVSMPMEMDYSDWLEQLLPENLSGQLGPTTLPSFQPPSSNNNLPLNNNFFMDYQNISQSFGNRDPLLSSSFNIFPTESADRNGDLKGNNRGGNSPMTLGENLLWDFF